MYAEYLNQNNPQQLSACCMFLPGFGNNLSEDPHSVVIAHVLKVHIIHLVSG